MRRKQWLKCKRSGSTARRDWNTPLDWNTGVVPNDYVTGSVTDVTLPTPPSPQPATYTVTISAGEGVLNKGILVNSVTISDSLATLAVDGNSSAPTKLTVGSTSATAFNNAGTLGLHNYATVKVDGGFTNSGTSGR